MRFLKISIFQWHIRFPGSSNEGRRVARPDIVLTHVSRWLYTEMHGVGFPLLDGLAMNSGMFDIHPPTREVLLRKPQFGLRRFTSPNN